MITTHLVLFAFFNGASASTTPTASTTKPSNPMIKFVGKMMNR